MAALSVSSFPVTTSMRGSSRAQTPDTMQTGRKPKVTLRTLFHKPSALKDLDQLCISPAYPGRGRAPSSSGHSFGNGQSGSARSPTTFNPPRSAIEPLQSYYDLQMGSLSPGIMGSMNVPMLPPAAPSSSKTASPKQQAPAPPKVRTSVEFSISPVHSHVARAPSTSKFMGFTSKSPSRTPSRAPSRAPPPPSSIDEERVISPMSAFATPNARRTMGLLQAMEPHPGKRITESSQRGDDGTASVWSRSTAPSVEEVQRALAVLERARGPSLERMRGPSMDRRRPSMSQPRGSMEGTRAQNVLSSVQPAHPQMRRSASALDGPIIHLPSAYSYAEHDLRGYRAAPNPVLVPPARSSSMTIKGRRNSYRQQPVIDIEPDGRPLSWSRQRNRSLDVYRSIPIDEEHFDPSVSSPTTIHAMPRTSRPPSSAYSRQSSTVYGDSTLQRFAHRRFSLNVPLDFQPLEVNFPSFAEYYTDEEIPGEHEAIEAGVSDADEKAAEKSREDEKMAVMMSSEVKATCEKMVAMMMSSETDEEHSTLEPPPAVTSSETEATYTEHSTPEEQPSERTCSSVDDLQTPLTSNSAHSWRPQQLDISDQSQDVRMSIDQGTERTDSPIMFAAASPSSPNVWLTRKPSIRKSDGFSSSGCVDSQQQHAHRSSSALSISIEDDYADTVEVHSAYFVRPRAAVWQRSPLLPQPTSPMLSKTWTAPSSWKGPKEAAGEVEEPQQKKKQYQQPQAPPPSSIFELAPFGRKRGNSTSRMLDDARKPTPYLPSANRSTPDVWEKGKWEMSTDEEPWAPEDLYQHTGFKADGKVVVARRNPVGGKDVWEEKKMTDIIPKLRQLKFNSKKRR